MTGRHSLRSASFEPEVPMVILFRSDIRKAKERKAYFKRVKIGIAILTVMTIGITSLVTYFVKGQKNLREQTVSVVEK